MPGSGQQGGSFVGRRLEELASAAALAYVLYAIWVNLDPDADPLELVARVRDWVRAKLALRESFRRDLSSIRDLPEWSSGRSSS